jgi:hypothetical protein
MAATARPKKTFDSKTLREFPKLGRYRVRLVENSRAEGRPVMDVREYLETEGFTGFTRRGIRLYTRREAAELAETLKQVLEDEMLPLDAKGGASEEE